MRNHTFEIVDHKSKAWGYVALPGKTGEFFTGWENDRVGEKRAHDLMEVGKNVIITGKFKVEAMARGRSAANFYGRFQGSEIRYELGMQSVLQVLLGLQANTHRVVSEHIWGQWTFAKQGQSILLTPVGATGDGP